MGNIIWFDKEGDTTKWESECLPIGNSYLGASMFGGVRHERIVLNEKTLWEGGPCEKRPEYRGGNKRDRYRYVAEVQRLLAEGKIAEEERLLPELTGESDFGTYLLLCESLIDFKLPNGEVKDYARKLDLDRSLYSCGFTVGGARYEREAFASFPDRTAVFRFTCSKAGGLSFTWRLDKTHPSRIFAEEGTLIYSGALEDNGMRFDARFKAVTDGTLEFFSDGFLVRGSTETIVYFTAATDYEMKYPVYRSGVSPETVTAPIIAAASKKGYRRLYDEHYRDYSALYGRVMFSLRGEYADLPADRLLEAYRNGERAAMNRLETLYFQYGRYLLISSSRGGTLPANLQGVWNESNTPPWCCDYHLNVNLQMNYWCAYNTNLAETALPLIDFLDGLREPGRVTAAEYCNIVSDTENPENGWTAHTQCSPFVWTAPGWDFCWGWSTAASAWLMQNIWEYYEFTGDKKLLRDKIFPIMR